MFGFGAVKRVLGAGAAEVKANYSENKDYLEAVVAAAALVANADGELEDAERQKIAKVINNHPTLSKFYKQNDIEQTIDVMFRRVKDGSGRQQLALELDDIKTRPEGRQMANDVYLIAKDIAMADGQMEPEEEVVLQKIANRLGVDTTQFDF